MEGAVLVRALQLEEALLGRAHIRIQGGEERRGIGVLLHSRA